MKTLVKTLLNALKDAVRPHRKAIYAGLAAGAVAAWPLVSKDHSLSTDDVYAILGAIAVGAGLTWISPANKPKTETR